MSYPSTEHDYQSHAQQLSLDDAAKVQFNTSSNWPVPAGWTGWKIRNDYPQPAPLKAASTPGDALALPLPDVKVESPWLRHDFRKDPLGYAKVVKEYCWEGNRETDFVVQENLTRPWFHAPWMHASNSGREPLKGLTYERPIPRLELAKSQKSGLQVWAIGFYNAPGASVFGGVWADPSKPVWNKHIKFPAGTCVFKLLFTTATHEEVPTMKGSPAWHAVIAVQDNAEVAPSDGGFRNTEPSLVRLLQVDWATVDERSPIGWVFGTFMYDGYLENISDPWDRLTAVGVTWGNDPQLDQAAVDAGEKPVESWINPIAEDIRKQFGGRRPSWGYNGRLNGPADNFISACASCHGTAQLPSAPMTQLGHLNHDKTKWIPLNEKLTMTCADYSLQFMIGWNNYTNWLKTNAAQASERDPTKRILLATPARRVVFQAKKDDEEEKIEKILSRIHIEEIPTRTGPELDWTRDDDE
ncbi:hypothetical protein FRB90_011740 [Tulasnella sp. 427]|nr:hypothetical protein FRB90_011740 [Tulasnella sp. 427]